MTADLLIELYELCLTHSTSYDELGKRLVNSLGVYGLSVWSKHPYFPEVLSRVVFHLRADNPDLVDKDQELAAAILETQQEQGAFNGKYYWGAALWGRQAHNIVLVWSEQTFSEEELRSLMELKPRLTILLDLMVITHPISSHRIAQELEMTRVIQKHLMPSLDALGGRKFLSYRLLPAHELGGDYLDILSFGDGSLGLTVADAMGKGIPGAFIMLLVCTLFRFLTREKLSPANVFNILNNQIAREVGDLGAFATQFYCIYDPATRLLQYANAGHNPPVIFHAKKGKITILQGKGVALGGKEGVQYGSRQAQLEAEDIVVIYSDGLQDMPDGNNQPFGLQGLVKAVIAHKEYDAEGICDGIIDTALRSGQTQTDDISLLVLKVE